MMKKRYEDELQILNEIMMIEPIMKYLHTE